MLKTDAKQWWRRWKWSLLMLLFHPLLLTTLTNPLKGHLRPLLAQQDEKWQRRHTTWFPLWQVCQRLSANVREGGYGLAVMNVYSMNIMCCDIKHVWDPVSAWYRCDGTTQSGSLCAHAPLLAGSRNCQSRNAVTESSSATVCLAVCFHCSHRPVIIRQTKRLMTACVRGQLFLFYWRRSRPEPRNN